LRLAVEAPSDDLQDLIWRVWQALSDEMQCSEPFDPMEIVSTNPAAADALATTNFINIPSNLPPSVMQQVLNQVLQQINVYSVVPVDFTVLFAAVESRRSYSHFRQKGEIRAVRLPDMNIQLNVTPKSQKWIFQENTALAKN